MKLLARIRNLFRKQAKPVVTRPSWAVKVHCRVHPPRPKPRSWSDKYYAKSRWARNRVSARMDEADVAAMLAGSKDLHP